MEGRSLCILDQDNNSSDPRYRDDDPLRKTKGQVERAPGRRDLGRQHVKIILGGASNSRDLQDLSTLIGERDEYTDSVTLGDRGARSNQRSIRRVPILPPDRIRTLPFGTDRKSVV